MVAKKADLLRQLDEAEAKLKEVRSIRDIEPCDVCGSTRFKCVRRKFNVITIPTQNVAGGIYLGESGDVLILDAKCDCCDNNLGAFKALGIDEELAAARVEYQSRAE